MTLPLIKLKITLRNTTWLNRIGFYLLSLVVLAIAGWSAGAVTAAALVGGLALVVWWIAGLGWVPVRAEEEGGIGSFEDYCNQSSISSSFHSD